MSGATASTCAPASLQAASSQHCIACLSRVNPGSYPSRHGGDWIVRARRRTTATEIDFINGSVVRWGERCDVATPVNRALVACVKGIELWMKDCAPKG
jgi:hypothetical protein